MKRLPVTDFQEAADIAFVREQTGISHVSDPDDTFKIALLRQFPHRLGTGSEDEVLGYC